MIPPCCLFIVGYLLIDKAFVDTDEDVTEATEVKREE